MKKAVYNKLWISYSQLMLESVPEIKSIFLLSSVTLLLCYIFSLAGGDNMDPVLWWTKLFHLPLGSVNNQSLITYWERSFTAEKCNFIVPITWQQHISYLLMCHHPSEDWLGSSLKIWVCQDKNMFLSDRIKLRPASGDVSLAFPPQLVMLDWWQKWCAQPLNQRSEGRMSPEILVKSRSSFMESLKWRDANKKSSVYRKDLCSPSPPPKVSTPLWCSKEGRKEKPARYCRCCSSPWQRCCHRFRGGLRRCWRGAWAWSWRRRAAGASSCWFCALWPGDSGTRSSPGDAEKVFLAEPLLLFTLKSRSETNALPVALIGWGPWPAPISSWWWCTCCSETPSPAPAAGGRCKPPGTCL